MHEVRPFTRADRDQLTELVNAHIAAVVPGWSVSTAVLLAHLERDTTQYVIDPWVVERQTMVAVCRDRIAAAAHLKRYGSDDRVTPDYHNAAEIAWLVCWPHAPFCARSHAAATAFGAPVRSSAQPTAGVTH